MDALSCFANHQQLVMPQRATGVGINAFLYDQLRRAASLKHEDLASCDMDR